MLAVAEGRLDQVELKWDPRPALCVVATSKGYPGKYPTGLPITGIDKADAMPDVKVFHSRHQARRASQIVTDGGRVLGVTALGNTIADAQQRAYEAMEQIHFDGMHYRRDIGSRAHRSVRRSRSSDGFGKSVNEAGVVAVTSTRPIDRHADRRRFRYDLDLDDLAGDEEGEVVARSCRPRWFGC